jgi:hypothetical protein
MYTLKINFVRRQCQLRDHVLLTSDSESESKTLEFSCSQISVLIPSDLSFCFSDPATAADEVHSLDASILLERTPMSLKKAPAQSDLTTTTPSHHTQSSVSCIRPLADRRSKYLPAAHPSSHHHVACCYTVYFTRFLTVGRPAI